MRCAMTRVLPEPAPARMRSAPSVCRTACCCSGLRLETRFIEVDSRPRSTRSSAPRPAGYLFYRDALREVARLIDVATAPYRDVVREQLERNGHDDRREQRRRARHRDLHVVLRIEHRGHALVAGR